VFLIFIKVFKFCSTYYLLVKNLSSNPNPNPNSQQQTQIQLPPHLQEISVDVSQNKKVVIKISSPNWNEIKSTGISRATFDHAVFTGLRVVPWNNKFFLNVREWRGDKSVVPTGSVVIFRALTGSRKHVYHFYYAAFLVREGARAEVTLDDHGESSDKKSLKLVVENLEPLPGPSDTELKNAEAEILNRGLEISKFVDSKNILLALYHYYVVKKVHLAVASQMQPVAPTTTTTVTALQPAESKVAKVVQVERERVLVKGFLVVHNLPSKSLLTTRLSEIFKETRIGQKIIKIVNGYFYNRLGVLSRDYYEILHKYATDVGFGYIIPTDVAPHFLREVDFMRRRYEIYEQWLKKFLISGEVPPELAENKRVVIDYEYVKLVKEYLHQHNISEEDWKKIVNDIHIADRFYVRLIPFSIDYSLLQEYVDEKAKQRVEDEINKLKEEIGKGVREKILSEAKKLLARIEQLAKTEITKEMLPKLRSEVDELEKRAAEFGVNVPELEKLKEMLTEEKLKEIALEASSGRLRALLNF